MLILSRVIEPNAATKRLLLIIGCVIIVVSIAFLAFLMLILIPAM